MRFKPKIQPKVKVTFRSAASPRRIPAGHLADTHISLGTFKDTRLQSNFTSCSHGHMKFTHKPFLWMSNDGLLNAQEAAALKLFVFFYSFHNCLTLSVHFMFQLFSSSYILYSHLRHPVFSFINRCLPTDRWRCQEWFRLVIESSGSDPSAGSHFWFGWGVPFILARLGLAVFLLKQTCL